MKAEIVLTSVKHKKRTYAYAPEACKQSDKKRVVKKSSTEVDTSAKKSSDFLCVRMSTPWPVGLGHILGKPLLHEAAKDRVVERSSTNLSVGLHWHTAVRNVLT